MAVVVQDAKDWRSRAALALFAAGKCWGGSGFVLSFGRGPGTTSKDSVRCVRSFDPDHVVTFKTTVKEEDRLVPGWFEAQVPHGTDPQLMPMLLESSNDVDVEPGDRLADDIANACSPYFLQHRDVIRPQLSSLSTENRGGLSPASAFKAPSTAGYAAAPHHVGGDLGLLLGLRLGFAEEPKLPFESEGDVSPEDRHDLIRFAVGGSSSARPRSVCWFGGGPAMSVLPESLPDAWSVSAVGTVRVGPSRIAHHRYIVVGDDPADFALAFALDRLMGGVTWLPSSLTKEEDLAAVRNGLRDLRFEDRRHSGKAIYTSSSLNWESVRDLCRRVEGDDSIELSALDDPYGNVDDPPVFQSAVDIDLSDGTHLSCAEHDYDIVTAFPGVAASDLTFTSAAPVPVHLPRQPELTGARPFWEVDVHIEGTMPPATRSLPSSAWFAVESQSWGRPWTRSSRAGLSFHAHSMGFVDSSQSLAQAVAQPRLAIPGLLPWSRARVSWVETGWRVDFSEAGRRAQVMARLLGSRDALLELFPGVRDLLTEFIPSSASSSQSYPESDGVCIGAGHGVLSIGAAERTLKSDSESGIRVSVDRLLVTQLIRRGLVLSCGDCGTKSFYPVDTLGQSNTCPRCAGVNELTQQRWKSPVSEPTWFYDLHGALRELLVAHGDVPILAAAHMRSRARSFRDLAEVDLITSEGGRLEVDLLGQFDDRVFVGEAKKRSTLGGGRARAGAIRKLRSVAEILIADEVVLASTDLPPWAPTDVQALRSELDAWRVRLPPPRIRLISGLGSDSVSDVYA